MHPARREALGDIQPSRASTYNENVHKKKGEKVFLLDPLLRTGHRSARCVYLNDHALRKSVAGY